MGLVIGLIISAAVLALLVVMHKKTKPDTSIPESGINSRAGGNGKQRKR